MNQKMEELLSAWLRLSIAVSNDRLVSGMPLNEAVICHLLYRKQSRYPEERMTATDLCSMTKMLKSQMNRTLLSMEEKGLIVRERSMEDKRQVFISMNTESELYHSMHEKALGVVNQLITRIGMEKADDIIQLFTLIADTADEVTK